MGGDMYSAESFPRLVRSLTRDGHHIVDFACGQHHIVAFTTTGEIYEWGNRTWMEPHPIPVPDQHREALKDIKKVVAGDKFSLALTSAGQLFSWGTKASGCLAQGSDIPKNVLEPTPVPAARFSHQQVVDVEASKNRCLAITHEGEFVSG